MVYYKDLASLELNTICVCLFARGDGKFHWAIIVPTSPQDARKYHAKDFGSGNWTYECVDECVLRSPVACAVVKIGGLLLFKIEAKLKPDNLVRTHIL